MADRVDGAPPQGLALGGPVGGFLRVADGAAVLGGWLAAGCLGALLLLILAGVVVAFVSKFFPALPGDIPVAWEYSAYLMGAAFLFGAAVALRAGSHIRVGVLLAGSGPAARRAIEIASSLAGLGVSGLLAWSLLRFTLRSWAAGQVSGGSFTPLWIPLAALSLGAAILALQMAARLLRAGLGLALEDGALKAAGLVE